MLANVSNYQIPNLNIMADYTVLIALPDHKRGDRWPGIASIGPVLINGAQPAAILTRVRMHLQNSSGAKFKLDSNAGQSPNAPIAIDNEVTWLVRIPQVQSFISVSGKWSWDMEFYQAGNSNPLTLYKGDLTVLNDTTK